MAKPPGNAGAAGNESPWRITVRRSLAEAEPAWRELQRHGIGYGFQTFQWQNAWQETFGQAEGVQPLIVELRGQDGRPLMLAPLGLHPGRGMTTLSFLGGWLTDYHAPLLDPEFARSLGDDGCRELLRQVFAALPRADYIHFWRMPVDVEGVPNPFAHLDGALCDEQGHATRLPHSYAAFEEMRGGTFTRWSRRKIRRLEKDGELVFTIATRPEQVGPMMDELIRQKGWRHIQTTGRNPYEDPRRRLFYERLVGLEDGDPRGVLCQLTVAGQIVATDWGYLHRGRFLEILPAFNPDWMRLGPGVVLKCKLIEWCIGMGLSTFDLTVGEESYKDDWADVLLPVCSFRRPQSVKGAAFHAYVRFRQLARRTLGPLKRRLAELRGFRPLAEKPK